MACLIHFRLCPHSRFIRLALGELALDTDLVEENPWEWRPEFLALNPAGSLPVLETATGEAICGAYAISEYLADTATAGRLLPDDLAERAEVRRLIEWFNVKLDRESTADFSHEKVYARLSANAAAPDAEILRAARANLRYHMSYVAHLAESRRWLAGNALTYADLAAAAHLSVADYLGEVPWSEFAEARTWYAKIKSRPSFRPLLADRLPGMPVPVHYADLDF